MTRPLLLALALAAPLPFTGSSALAQTQQVVIRVDGATPAPEGAVLRGLDRTNGAIQDFTLAPGETLQYERLVVTLRECRYPEGNAQTEAFAFLTIRDVRSEDPAFEGWMFASSPALSSLDHPRYDVWVLNCKI